MKNRAKKVLAVLFILLCLSGCGSKAVQQAASDQTAGMETQSEAAQAETKETETETDQVRQQENKDTAILVVSFGTSFNDNRDATIGAIEQAIGDAFSDYEVRRAFTSQIIIDKLKERDNLAIDNVTESLDRAVADGIKELILQPTHLMDGYEYNDILDELSDYVDKFDKLVVGDPLLTTDEDFHKTAKAITERTASYDDGKTAICFMGHGTEADSNQVYEKMQAVLKEDGFENYYIGTVEASPGLEDVVAALKEKGGYEKVVLQPLMVVAGDHANNDMAGDEEDSWKNVLEGEGYEVECILEGLGQIPAIRDIYVEHVKSAAEKGVAFTGAEKEESVVLKNGTYAIEVDSSSSMFRIVRARLTVEDNGMSADITLSGTGYSKLYMGTASEAEGAAEEEYIPFSEDEEGAYTYTIPVEALDKPLDCAAFSKKKSTWYDRQLTFHSSSAAEEGEGPQSLGQMKDGVYEVDLVFAGGSGKAEVLSPAKVTVADGAVTAEIRWNSPNYDYMLVDGEKYLPINEEGDSVFEIPVPVFDEEIKVIGDTVAMSSPHEVEYTLLFRRETMKQKQP